MCFKVVDKLSPQIITDINLFSKNINSAPAFKKKIKCRISLTRSIMADDPTPSWISTTCRCDKMR